MILDKKVKSNRISKIIVLKLYLICSNILKIVNSAIVVEINKFKFGQKKYGKGFRVTSA